MFSAETLAFPHQLQVRSQHCFLRQPRYTGENAGGEECISASRGHVLLVVAQGSGSLGVGPLSSTCCPSRITMHVNHDTCTCALVTACGALCSGVHRSSRCVRYGVGVCLPQRRVGSRNGTCDHPWASSDVFSGASCYAVCCVSCTCARRVRESTVAWESWAWAWVCLTRSC